MGKLAQQCVLQSLSMKLVPKPLGMVSVVSSVLPASRPIMYSRN